MSLRGQPPLAVCCLTVLVLLLANETAGSGLSLQPGNYELRTIVPAMAEDKQDTRLRASVKVAGTKLVIDTEAMVGNEIAITGAIRDGEIDASFTGEEEGQQMTIRLRGKVTRPTSAHGTLSFLIDNKPAFDGKWLLTMVPEPKAEEREGDKGGTPTGAGPSPQEPAAPCVPPGEQTPLTGKLRRVPVAYKTIQQAIDAASEGDTVLVADGTYRGSGNTNLDFKGKAITVKSENGPEKCIIDCRGRARGFHFHSGETSTSVVSGFTISRGRGAKLGRKWAGTLPTVGGAILCDGAGPTIENNALLHNSADLGGAIACFDSNGIRIVRNEVVGNRALDAPGGGVSLHGSRSAVVQGNLIQENRTKSAGGGIHLQSCSRGRVEGNRILDNRARSGGGMGISNSSPLVQNNVIARNESSGTTNGPFVFDGGGAMGLWDARVQVVNNTIVANRAWIRGGAVAVAQTNGARFINNVFWQNYSPQGKDIYLAFYQSSTEHASTITVEHCVWQGGKDGYVVEKGCELSAVANTKENPIIAHPDEGDYRLTDASPCIDRGQAEAAPKEDIEGTRRPQGFGVDIGAFEHRIRRAGEEAERRAAEEEAKQKAADKVKP